MKKQYNHAFTICFSAITSHPEAEDITQAQMADAIRARLANLIEHDELLEAVGSPFDTFEMESDVSEAPTEDGSERTHIELKGLGSLTIVRTDEGVIIDVHDQGQSESIASVGLLDEDFLEGYAEAVMAHVQRIDPGTVVNSEFIDQAFKDKLNVIEAVESWCADSGFDVSLLQPIESAHGMKAVRPHIKVSGSSAAKLAGTGKSAFTTTSGNVVGLVAQPNGYVLAPLVPGEGES